MKRKAIKSLTEIAVIYLKLQTALCDAFQQLTEEQRTTFGKNRTFSPLGLTDQVLMDFSKNPQQKLVLDVKIEGGFIKLSGVCVRYTESMAKNPNLLMADSLKAPIAVVIPSQFTPSAR